MSFGGNAVSAAFCCAKLGIVPDLMTSLADDWLARMFLDMAAKYGISVHGRKVKESSLSFVMPNHGHARDHPLPRRPLSASGAAARHLRLPRAASRRPSGRCGDPVREALPREGHPHLARRRRDALQHAGAARIHRRCDLLASGCASSSSSARRRSACCCKDKGCRIGGVTLGAQGPRLVRRARQRSGTCRRWPCRRTR